MRLVVVFTFNYVELLVACGSLKEQCFCHFCFFSTLSRLSNNRINLKLNLWPVFGTAQSLNVLKYVKLGFKFV